MGPLVEPFEPQASLAAAKREFGEFGGVNASIESSTTFTGVSSSHRYDEQHVVHMCVVVLSKTPVASLTTASCVCSPTCWNNA